MITRRSVIGGGVLLAGTVLAGCGSAVTEEKVLRVGSQRGSTKALLVASNALAGAPYSVEWSEFPAAQHLLEAIGSGAVDIGLVGDAPFAFAYQSNGGIRAVAALTVNPRPAEALTILVPKGSPVRTVADLRGKKVATTRGSIGHYLVLAALEKAGLPPDAVDYVFLAPGDAKAAFSAGAVDAWSTWTPYIKGVLNDGGRIVVDGRDIVVGYGFIAANLTAIEKRRPLIADFLTRQSKALAWSRGHVAEYGKVIAAETGLPVDIATDMADKFQYAAVPIHDATIHNQALVFQRFERAGTLKLVRKIEDGYDKSFNSSI